MKSLFNCIFFSILTLMFTPLVYGYQCEPPLTGAPCAQSGLANYSQAEPSLNLAAGNPINIITGNKYQLENDLPANIHAPGIEIIRHYNSSDTSNRHIGHGWKLSYDTKLYKINNSWQIIQADGSRVIFSANDLNNQGIYKNEYGQLSHINGRHFWRWSTGTDFEFDENGNLVSIHWPNSEQLYIQRFESDHALAGAIKQVLNIREQLLFFHYNQDQLISEIDTALGKFSYKYDKQKRLISVIRPDGMRKHYGYDAKLQSNNKYSLTSVDIQQNNNNPVIQINQWQYDAQNRAISYKDTLKSTNNLNIEYVNKPSKNTDGLTIVNNHLNQETRFTTVKINGKYLLKEVSGKGCYGCAAPGTNAKYDDKARLIEINGTKIIRHKNGLPKTLMPNTDNWNQLQLNYSQDGLLQNWQSKDTGKTSILYNQQNLPIKRIYSNNDSVEIKYDAFKRPSQIIEKNDSDSILTQLEWSGNQLIKINHPNESETREYDDLDRIVKRHISRADINYNESFSYDNQNRLIKHKLPEGGSLNYKWGAQQQITGIYWQDINGSKHSIIDSINGQSGYYYGNWLKAQGIADSQNRLRALELINIINKQEPKTIWSQYLDYDEGYRIKHESFSLNQSQQKWLYEYDNKNRLIGTANYNNNHKKSNNWLAWGTGGKLIAHAKTNKVKTKSTNSNIEYDASGLPTKIDSFKLVYGPDRRLKQVQNNQQTVANYIHNAYGQRISNYGNKINSDYLYLNNQLVATSNNGTIKARFIYANLVPVAMIQYQKNSANLFYIHADAQATPRLITDVNQNIVWQAKYTPFGYAYDIQGDIKFDLRLAGQIYDVNTGWHDNLLRTYDPKSGHYLEPDPLGPIPINQSYGYANQMPRQYADPLGLLLFAFDGTRQSIDTKSNVWKMTQYYVDGPIYYHHGPGNSDSLNWDALTAANAQKIIEKQWQQLLLELHTSNKDETIPIDIIGFSRGAALARHFGNQIGQYVNQGLFEYHDIRYGSISACVDLRFMGLFDSVAQFGILGSQNHLYDLSINSAWDWVAHAVALNEHRSLFPLLIANDNGAYNVVEMPFIGAHSDIGGGILPSDIDIHKEHGDLSKVALNWMIWQAKAASLDFTTVSNEDTSINQPIIHDYRYRLIRSVQNGDRAIQSSSGKPMLSYQDDHDKFGRTTRQETEQFINRNPKWRRKSGAEVGTVDMDGYTEWLNESLGWQMPL